MISVTKFLFVAKRKTKQQQQKKKQTNKQTKKLSIYAHVYEAVQLLAYCEVNNICL